jgi:hypothetical protein
MFNGLCFFFQIPVQLHCPPTACLTHLPSLLANQERLWTFDLDKSHVRGRYNCVRDVRRSHCQPFCACVLLSWSEHMLAPSWSREIALSRFSVSSVSIFSTRGLSIPTIWGLCLGFYILLGKEVPALPQRDVSCCLIVVALRLGQGRQHSRSANELRLQNFLTMWGKMVSEDRDHGNHISSVHKPRQETSQGWPNNFLVVGILELCDVWMRRVGWHAGKAKYAV